MSKNKRTGSCIIWIAILIHVFLFSNSPSLQAEEVRIKFENNKGLSGFKDKNGKIVIPAGYDDASEFIQGLAVIKKGCRWRSLQCIGGKWGLINSDGIEIVPPKYDKIQFFDHSGPIVAIAGCRWEEGVCLGGKYGILDRKGRVIVPFVYNFIDPFFSDGLTRANMGCKIVWEDLDNPPVCVGGKWGFIDTSGNIAIPFIYDRVMSFQDGLGQVQKNAKGKIGFIDKNNAVVIPFEYDESDFIEDGTISLKKNGKWGCVDLKGGQILPFMYESSCTLTGDLIFIKDKSGYVIFDRRGNEKFRKDYEQVWEIPPYEVSWGMKLRKVQKDHKVGYINSKWEEVIPVQYRSAEIKESKAEGETRVLYIVVRDVVEKKNHYGLYAIDGSPVLPVEYENVRVSGSGTMVMVKNQKEGLLNPEGKIVLQPVYDEIGKFHEGLAKVRSGNQYGYINPQGKVIIPVQFDSAGDFGGGLSPVGIQGKYGFIDTAGKTVVPMIYDGALGASIYKNNIDPIFVKKSDKWALVQPGGKSIGPFNIDEIVTSGTIGVARVKMNGKWRDIDAAGQCANRCE